MIGRGSPCHSQNVTIRVAVEDGIDDETGDESCVQCAAVTGGPNGRERGNGLGVS
jgi:hypothetical protein